MAFTTIAPKQVRDTGPLSSSWVAVPVGSTRVTLRALMNNPDIRDTTLVLPFRVWGSPDAGATSYLLVEGTWEGGHPNRDGTFSPAMVSIQTPNMPPHMRGEAVLPRSVNIGLEAEVV